MNIEFFFLVVVCSTEKMYVDYKDKITMPAVISHAISCLLVIATII